MFLDISNQHPHIRIDLARLGRRLSATWKSLHLGKAQVSILLTDNSGIRSLNCRFRQKDEATDVLSFGMREKRQIGDLLPPHPEILGDLAVSLSRVKEQAKEQGLDWQDELGLVLIHGLLHLLGYDHSREADARRMFALQASLQCFWQQARGKI